MTDIFNNTGFIALTGTIFGGAGLKFVESWLGKAKERATEAQGIREELRIEISNLRALLDKADIEEKRLELMIEEWRSKYYDLRDAKTKIETELTITIDRLKAYQLRLDSEVK